MSDNHNHLVADILDLGATLARGTGEMLGGAWGVPSGKVAGEFLNAAASALRGGVDVRQATEAIKKLKPLDFATSRAENDARANALPVKP